jgi:hypothetical protein
MFIEKHIINVQIAPSGTKITQTTLILTEDLQHIADQNGAFIKHLKRKMKSDTKR